MISDERAGLGAAVRKLLPDARRQRCTVHSGGASGYANADTVTHYRSFEKSYWDAGGYLRVHQTNRDSTDWVGTVEYGAPWGAYEEYWYDALGRRILKRSRQESPICTDASRCYSSIERIVWDGDQVLWEVRQAGSGDTQNPTGSPLTGQTGHVGYVYAGGLDAPIGLIRNNTAVALHYNWKGLVVYGTDDAGTPTSCPPGGSGCSVVSFPGVSWGASGGIELPRNTEIWYGQVPMGFLDRTGLVYRRNRFYDPTAGQFTQPDPIGFAGGLNIYGYAGGDPVNGSDPFGLASAPVVEQVDCEYYPHDMQCAGYPPRDPRDRQGGGSTPAGGLGGGGGGGRRGNGDGTDPGALLPCLASIGFAATVDLATGAFLLYGGPATAVAAAVRGGFGVLAAATRPSGQVVARTASWWIYRSGAVSRAAEGGVAQLGANGAYLFGGVVSAHAVEVGFWSDMGSGRSLSDAVINILLDTAMPGRATYRATGCL